MATAADLTWQGERIARTVHDPLVAIVALGHPRRFLLRPLGGSSQRTWQHAIPKVAQAGPRISLTLRHSTNQPDPAS